MYLGLFAKLIIQIPVDGGYEDGKLKVLGKTGQDVTLFDFSQESKRHFSAAAFSSDYKHEWQPVKRGFVVAMEYDLIWQPCSAFTISSLDFSTFLSAFQLAKEALSSWCSNQPIREEIEEGEIVSDEESALKTQLYPTIPTQLKVYLAPDDFEPTPNIQKVNVDESVDHLLVIPLKGTYYETNLNFTSLHGSDSQAAHILQSIDFVDVHLAIIGQQQSEASDERHFQIVQWIYSNTSVPQFQNYRLDMAHQLIGQMKTNLVFNSNSTPKLPHYAALVVQPQRQSIRRCSSLKLDAVLTYLESRIRLDGDSKMMRLRSVACLDNIISYCQESPLKVWYYVPEDGGTETILRLLNICRDLQSSEAGLLLIQSFGHHCGVDNELVARSIAETAVNTGKHSTYITYERF